MAPCPVKMHEDLLEGKLYVDSFEGNPQREGPLTSNEGISSLHGCECSGLNISNNPLQKIPKGQPEIWCLFGTQIVKTLLDTGAYRSLIKPTVLERTQKDAILVQDDEIHTLRCANKTTNETLGSVRLRFTISDETYEHWFLVFRGTVLSRDSWSRLSERKQNVYTLG